MSYRRRPNNPGYWDYDGLPIQADRATHEFVVTWAAKNLGPGAPVLDIAAGRGALSKALIDQGFAVSCTSWDGRVGLEIPTYRCDLDYPFDPSTVGDRRYALACAIEIIEHVENPSGFLRSCAAVLEPGGHLILSTPNVSSVISRFQWFFRGRPNAFDAGEVRKNRHISMIWREGIEYLIEMAGLRIVESHLSGAARLGTGWRAAVKRPVIATLERLLSGDTRGVARLYVLAHSGTEARKAGPGEVY